MGGDSAPNYQEPSISSTDDQYGNSPLLGGRFRIPGKKGLPGGNDLEAYAKDLLKNGLPKDIQENEIKQTTGALAGLRRESEQAMRERQAQTGGTPIGAQLAGEEQIAGRETRGLNNLYSGLANQNFEAKQSGFGDYSSLINQALGKAGQQNQYNMQKYQADQAGKFDIGNFLGSVLGTGGNIAGGIIGRPGKGGDSAEGAQ
jgi:hypothetical protein